MGCGSSVSVDNDRTVANNLDKTIHEAARSSKDENKSSNGLSANDLYKGKNFEKKEISTQVSFESLSAEQPLPKEKTNDVEKKDISTQTSLVSLAKEMPIEKKEKATQASLEKERVSECLGNEQSKQREKEKWGNEDKANKNLPDKNEDVKGKNKDLTKANDVKFDFEDIDAHALKAPDDVCGSTRDLADYLMKGTTDQLYIARSFYRWITDNISYDTESFFGDKKKPVDAESVLRLRTAVCAGYAYLFEELCKHAGIKVKVIGGYTKGYRYNPENPFSYRYKTDHAWNAISINNKWHFVESTWGAGNLDKQGKFQKEFDDYYFLTDPKHFISDHFPYIDRDIEGSKQWQLLDPPFTLEEFSKAVNFTRFARTWGLKFSHNDAVIQVDKAFELEIQDTRRALIDSSMDLIYSNGLRCDEYMFFRLTQSKLYKATIRLPKRGTYKLEVYGKVDSLQDGLNNLVTYILKCPSVDSTVQPYPKHSGLWGFDSKAFDIGFRHSIAPKIMHKALHGKLSLELPADIVPPSMLRFTGTSSNEDLERFTFLETKSNALQVRIRLPRKEFYKLEVLCKTDDSERYYPVMSFLIDGTHGTLDKAVPFPKTYPQTQEFLCELLEPTTGILSANTPIAFRFKSPKLVKGFVQGTNYTYLKITEDVWEAKVTTNESGGVLSVNGNDTANLQLPNSTSREIQKIWDELKKTGESPPQMVFSILGDSENLVPKPWPKQRFQNALVDAAKCAGECWLLFRNRAYVSDIVREAILIHNAQKEDPMIQLLSVDDMIVSLAEKSEEDEILLSVELERFLTKHNIKKFGIRNHTLKIPVVEIVVEGGLKTIRHIALAVQNNIPVVVVKGSGKASDLIVEYLRTAPDQRENMAINTYPLLFGSTFSKGRKTAMLKGLKDIRENHSMIHVFDVENDGRERLCELIGEAVIRAWAYEELKADKPKTPKKEDGLSLLNKSLNQPLTAAKVEALEPLNSYERYILPTPGKTATSLPLYFYMGYQYIEEISEIQLKTEEVKQSKEVLLLEALRTNRTNYVQILLERLSEVPAILCDLYESTILCKEELTCKECKQWTNVTCKQLTKVDLPFRSGECNNSECWTCPDCYEKDMKKAELMRCHKHIKCRKCLPQEVEYMKECMNEDCVICKDCYTEHLMSKYVRRCKKHLSCETCRQLVKPKRRCGCKRCDDCKLKLIPAQLCKECGDCKFCITPMRIEMDECKKCNRCSDCKKPDVVHYKYCPKCETCARCLEPECEDQHVLPDKCPHLGMYWLLQSICPDTTEQLLHTKEELLGLQPDFSIETCEKYTSEMAQMLCRMILGYELVGCSCSPYTCCCNCLHYPKSIGKNRIKAQEAEMNALKEKKKEDIYLVEEDGFKEFLNQLLLWSLIANRKDISGLVWKFVPNQLVTALMSAKFLGKLADRAINVQRPSLGKELREHAQLFEKRSLAMLDGIYDLNAKEAMRLLDDEVKVWGIKTSAREFAYDNAMYEIIAHQCIQRKLLREWFDNDIPSTSYYFKGLFKGQATKALSAPIAKFWYHYLLFTCMLVFLSSFILTSVDDTNYHFEVAKMWEFAVYLWAGMDMIEGVISFGTFSFCPCDMKGFRRSSKSQKSVCSRMAKSLSDFWNIVDLLSYLLLIAAFLVRHFIPGDFTIPRKFFGISLLTFFIRYLQILMPFKKAGVTLILIKEMMKEMWYYLVVLFILLMSVGVYYHAIMYPSHLQIFGPGEFDTWSFWKIIYYPYFQIFGDLSLDYLEGTLASCSSIKTEWENDSNIERCPIEDWTVTAIAMVFLLIANLLVVNLIIAKFSSSFEEIRLKSLKQWRYERYSLVTEYSNRIPAPFNIFRLLWPCVNKCRKRKVLITDREAKDEKNRQEYQNRVAAHISI